MSEIDFQYTSTDNFKDNFDEDFVYRTIRPHFDINYYERLISRPYEDAVLHYIRFGWKEGRDPHPDFSTQFYLNKYPDVAASGLNPFFHFLIAGNSEGRATKEDKGDDDHIGDLDFAVNIITPEFDREYYKLQLEGNGNEITNLELHYLVEGWKRGLDPNPAFSTSYYLESNGDVFRSGVNPFLHYVGWGRAEGRHPVPDTIYNTNYTLQAMIPTDSLVITQPRWDNDLLEACNINDLDSNAQSIALDKLRNAFDETYYLDKSPDLIGSGIDPFKHYMIYGWKEHRDPSAYFSTSYYLTMYTDIASANINPFTHFVLYGQFEGRRGQNFYCSLYNKSYNPFLTVIVPNFNHARFLTQRIESILQQTYQNFEIIILDDNSSDESVEIIRSFEYAHPERVRTILNERNSGNVFSQWKLGLEAATGALIWICESDDFCEPTFLEHCIQPFRDPSVMISFGRIQFADEHGVPFDGLDNYREQAEPRIWTKPFVRFAYEWFRGAFAVSNVIPNVGGCVFRRQRISDEIWQNLLTFRISGDWYLYLKLAAGGQIAYCPSAVAYFRQHRKNTSVTGFNKPHYYQEHERIITECRRSWGTSDDVALRMYIQLYYHYKHVYAYKTIGSLSKYYSNDNVLSVQKTSTHILICFLGFYLGGGELFPIYLANALLNIGYTVSALCLETGKEEPLVRAMLDSRIPVYDAQFAREYGLTDFISKAGIDIIHTHNAGLEFLFFGKSGFSSDIPYIVTLHGSYEVTPLPDDVMFRILRGVSHWVYLSPKNLSHLSKLPISLEYISMIPNGMPIDEREFLVSRADLDISDSALVFVIASRAIKEKGWEIAIQALEIAQKKTSVQLHLLLCGSGPVFDNLSPHYVDHDSVHFMGFQERIPGAYRLGDVALLPTRFPGESYPLSLIQAMQAGRPVIATDIGEIRNMLTRDDRSAGIILPFLGDDEAFVQATADAMLAMTDRDNLNVYKNNASKIGMEYSIENVANIYSDLIQKVKQNNSERQFII